MKVLKKAVMYLLVGVLAISLSNGGIVVKADSIEKSPEEMLEEQMSKLTPIDDKKQIEKWEKYLQKNIDKGKIELQGNNYDYDNLSFYEIQDSSIVTVSIPIKSPDHHKISNVAVHIDKDTKELVAYTELELKRSEQNTFQLVTYINGELKVNEVYSETFMTAEEYKEKNSQVIRPYGIDWGGVADCLDMPKSVLLNVAYICGAACVITLGTACVVCVAVAVGAGSGAVSACISDNWN